jgi:purine-binding chemotaxis protein CheW
MSTHAAPPPGRYLTFHLGTSYYGVPIREVREVVRLCAITPVPNMPAHIRGVINLRGSVLPVFDLRAKFGMVAVEYDDRACIVVFDRQQDRLRQGTAIGAIVDGVDDVLVLSDSQLAAAPDFAGTVEADYLLGVGTTPERVFSLLHMKNILAADGSVVMPAITPQAASGGTELP